MLDCFKCLDMKKTGIFAAGVLFGTAGIKILSSKDAKKGLYKLYGSSFTSERVRNENRKHYSGECGGYL